MMQPLDMIPAGPEHEQFLFDLRNHPSTRCQMFDDREVKLSDHQQWFEKSLEKDSRDIFILQKGAEPIGQIRFDSEDDQAWIDFAVTDRERSKGYGTLLLLMGCRTWLAAHPGISAIHGRVKKDNTASRQAFLKAGFRFENETDTYIELTFYPEHPNLVVATVKSWNISRFYEIKASNTAYNWILMTDPEQLTPEVLDMAAPEFVFFPHWSSLIPESVFDRFKCVVFHMTDLPFGRGGSPMQNLISRGIYKTKISAITVVREVDGGDIYCKKDFDLSRGSAEELFDKASAIIYSQMIPEILSKRPVPVKQEGEPVCFGRRTPEQGNLAPLDSLDQVYDYIRMLDGEGYPPAFIEVGDFRLEFSQAAMEADKVTAVCRIIKINQTDPKNGSDV